MARAAFQNFIKPDKHKLSAAIQMPVQPGWSNIKANACEDHFGNGWGWLNSLSPLLN